MNPLIWLKVTFKKMIVHGYSQMWIGPKLGYPIFSPFYQTCDMDGLRILTLVLGFTIQLSQSWDLQSANPRIKGY